MKSYAIMNLSTKNKEIMLAHAQTSTQTLTTVKKLLLQKLILNKFNYILFAEEPHSSQKFSTL